MLRIIVPLHNLSVLGLKVMCWWSDIQVKDFLVESRIHGSINYSKSSKSWSSKAAPDHDTITTMSDCQYDVLFLKCCVSFTPDVTGCTPSKKFHFCPINPQNIFPSVLGIIKMFCGKCDTGLCGLLGEQRFSPCNSPMDAIFAQSLFYCWIMNTDLKVVVCNYYLNLSCSLSDHYN